LLPGPERTKAWGWKSAGSCWFNQEPLLVAAVILFGLTVVPGLPTLPFLILANFGFVSYLVFRRIREKTQETALPWTKKEEEVDDQPETFNPLPPIDVLALEVGYGLIPLVDMEQNGELLERIKSIRLQIAQEVGIVVPSIHIQDNMKLRPGAYSILLKGIEVAKGDLMVNHLMAMNPGGADDDLKWNRHQRTYLRIGCSLDQTLQKRRSFGERVYRG
jgi:flagellar biosynthesis protein FlhA